jgi:hypothetical protein
MSHSHRGEWDRTEAKLRANHEESYAVKLQRYKLGAQHADNGVKPTNQNADYLLGYDSSLGNI